MNIIVPTDYHCFCPLAVQLQTVLFNQFSASTISHNGSKSFLSSAVNTES